MTALRCLFKPKGFTLIEMLVTVSIMLIVVSGGIVAYSRFNDRQTVLTSAKEVQTLIRSAQTKARVKETPEGCRLQGYKITSQVVAGVTELKLVAQCGPDNVTISNASTGERVVKLSKNITLEQEVEIMFWSLYGGVTVTKPAPSSGESEIIIRSNSDSSMRYGFKVSTGGEITEGAWK